MSRKVHLTVSHGNARTYGDEDMMMLMRRLGESVVIGDIVEVALNGIDGRQVHLEVTAPRAVGIWRKAIKPLEPKLSDDWNTMGRLNVMLRLEEVLVVGEFAEVSIATIEKDQVCLGINAPRVVPIVRSEAWVDTRVEPQEGNAYEAPTPRRLRRTRGLNQSI
jgi:carbon storage regulator CsrA